VGIPSDNPNNYLNPDRLIKFRLQIMNGLTANMLTAYGTIRSLTPGVIVTDSTGTYNNILAGHSVWSIDDYEINVSNTIPLGTNLEFFLIVTQALPPTGPWMSYFSFPIAPLKVSQIFLDDDQFPDSYGNNNRLPEPGETIEVIPLINNWSMQSIFSVSGKLTEELPGVSVWNNVTGVSGIVFDSCRYNVAAGFPQPIVASATNIQPEYDYVFDYSNISPYSSLPFNLEFNGYLEDNPSSSWETGGIRIKWENPFIMTNGIVSSRDQITIEPNNLQLKQNYPNPFNPTTTIGFGIQASPNPSKGGAFVTLKVYDVLGNEVKTLVNKEMEAGYHSIDFNASELPSGVYFYQLRATPSGGQAGAFVETRKMVLLR